MIAMAAQPILRDLDLLVAVLRVGITDIAIAAHAGMIIDIMREDGSRPLLRNDRVTADIAGIFGVVHCQVTGTRVMRMTGKMFHAENMMTTGAATSSLSLTLIA